MAFLGSRGMKFTYVSDANLHTLLFNNGLSDELLLGRFRLINERYKPLRLYYQPTPGAGDWIETQLEPLGNGFAEDCRITLVPATLGNLNAPAVLVTMEWKTGDRGGETSRRAINLIDLTREPVLVLRSEPFVGRVSVDHDTEADPTETGCEQPITLRNGEIVIGAPEEAGDGGCEITLLPAGRYSYQRSKGAAYGKLVAVPQ